MPNINITIIAGHIGKDPEVRHTPAGGIVASFSVAISRQWKNKQGETQKETSWVDVECWGKTAEFVVQYFKKGSAILVEGHLKQDVWEKEGKKNSKLKLVADRVQFCSDKAKHDGGNDDQQEPTTGTTDLPF